MDNAYIKTLRTSVKKQFGGDKSRYWHTIGVADTCACLAMRYEADMEAAFTAGLLHDCAKCLADDELLRQCRQNHIAISEYEEQMPYLLHGKLGAFYAAKQYHITDADILNAITYHTTGRPRMSLLEMIVFIADYIEPYRNKAQNLALVRKTAFADIRQAVFIVAGNTIAYLKACGQSIDPQTVETYEYYKKLIEQQGG